MANQSPRTSAQNQSRSLNLFDASIRLDCISTQQDRVYALLLAIRGMAPEDDLNLSALIDIALDLQADNKHWSALRKALCPPEAEGEQ